MMDGVTAVVTGASSGIGNAVATEFGAAGAHVVVCGRDAETLATAAEDIRAEGGTVTDVRADVRDEFDVERVMEQAAREGEDIGVVVANAGVYHGDAGETPLPEEPYAAFDDHLRTNARGVFATIREAVPHLAADARVLAFGKQGEQLGLPDADASLEAGDRVVAIADFDVLREVEQIIVGETDRALAQGGV